MNQPSSKSVNNSFALPPDFRRARSTLSPSGLLTAPAGIAGLKGEVVEVGRTPDRRAAAPVRHLAGIDRNHAERAQRMEVPDALAQDHAVEQHDLALHVADAGRRVIAFAEHNRTLRAIAVRWTDRFLDVDQLRLDALRRRQRHRSRAQVQAVPIGFHIAEPRHGEIKARLVHGDGHAVRLQSLDDCRDRAIAFRSALAPDGREMLDHRPGLIECRTRDQRGFVLGHRFSR